MDGSTLPIIIMIILVMLSAYFSATETAFSSLNKTRIKTLAENGNKRANLVLELSEKYGLHVNPDAIIEDITVGMQQRTEILKMLYRDNEILIFFPKICNFKFFWNF